MKKFLTILLICSALLMTACGNHITETSAENTSAETSQTAIASHSEETTVDPVSSILEWLSDRNQATAETVETAETKIENGVVTQVPKYYELNYMDSASFRPISTPYQTVALQSRSRSLAVIARIYNKENYPIFVDGASMSVNYGKSKVSGGVNVTSFYIMPKQTGFIVLKSSPADDAFDPYDVEHTYSIRTLPSQKNPKSYDIECAAATAEHYGITINSIAFELTLGTELETKLFQANVILFDKEGNVIDAFTKKAMETDGKLRFTYIPSTGNVNKNDLASFFVTLTSQCNE